MELLKFLEGKTYEQAKEILEKEPYSLITNEDGDYFILKYNQIESDMSNPIVKECRGIILRKDNYKVVCHPFNKFFNYGEERADKIDWNTAKVQEKVDGSIMKLWYDAGEWRISTNGVIDARATKNPMDKTFFGMFMEAYGLSSNEPFDDTGFLGKLNKDYTYMFEMVHPLNRIVVRYEKPMLFHIGTRNNVTGEELNVDIGIQKPKEYSFNKFEEVIEMAEKLPYSEEGYVVVDGNWNRVKVKSPSYLAVHHLKNNGVVTYKRIMELVMKGEQEEFLAYFPEFKPYFDKAEKKYNEYLDTMNKAIDEIRVKSFEDRKAYALTVTKYPCPDFFFKVLDNKYDWDDFPIYVADMGSEKVAKLLKLKDEETEATINESKKTTTD